MATEAVSAAVEEQVKPGGFLRTLGGVLLASLKAYFVVGIFGCVLIVVTTPLRDRFELGWNISKASSLIPYSSLASMVCGTFLTLPVILGMAFAASIRDQKKVGILIAFAVFSGMYGLLLHSLDHDIPFWLFAVGGMMSGYFYTLITPIKLSNKVFYVFVGAAAFLMCLDMSEPWIRLHHQKYMQSHPTQMAEYYEKINHDHYTKVSIKGVFAENLDSACYASASVQCLIQETVKLRLNLNHPLITNSSYRLSDDEIAQIVVDLGTADDAKELLKVLPFNVPERRMQLLFTAGEYDQATSALYDLQKTEKIGEDYGAVRALTQRGDLDKALEIATLTIDWHRTVKDEHNGIGDCGGIPEIYPRPIEILSETFAKKKQYDKAYAALKLIERFWNQNYNGNRNYCSEHDTGAAYYGAWVTLIVSSIKNANFVQAAKNVIKFEQGVLNKKNGGYITTGLGRIIARVILNYDPPPVPWNNVATLSWPRSQFVKDPCDVSHEKLSDEGKLACYVEILNRVRGYINGPNHL